MKRHRRGRTRAGRSGMYGLDMTGRGRPADLEHAYKHIIAGMRNNSGETKSMWRHWGAQEGIPKALTDRVLTVAERRRHVTVREGRYYLTPRGYELLHPWMREGAT